MGYGAMHGIPMMASSPMRHDVSNIGVGVGHDVQGYEPPWKALCDFALHSDLDRLHPNAPPYQNIVNQVTN
jgi:insulin gene enhancer protein ISL-1